MLIIMKNSQPYTQEKNRHIRTALQFPVAHRWQDLTAQSQGPSRQDYLENPLLLKSKSFKSSVFKFSWIAD
jgi:hypothetical protein